MAAVNLLTTSTTPRPWIAVMDLNVTKNSPAGSCVLAEVMGLADEHDITVFSDAFDNNRPDRVQWVRVPLPKRPAILRYVMFHVLAHQALRRHSRERGCSPQLVQATQGQYVGADICYAHFCNRAYLNDGWKSQNATGWLRLLRWLGHHYNAVFEQRAFRRSRLVVTPSRGLAAVIEETYPFLRGRVQAIPNPIDIAAFTRPANFDQAAKRRALGLSEVMPVLCFAALGNFSHKGLEQVLRAMALLHSFTPSLIVVGGRHGEVDEYKRMACSLGLSDRIVFTGFQADVRPFFWASDLFVLPSISETFSLVVLQAMAAGMPAITTRLHGVEDYAVDGENAWIVAREADAIKETMERVFSDPAGRGRAADAAVLSAKAYDTPGFIGRWRTTLTKLLP